MDWSIEDYQDDEENEAPELYFEQQANQLARQREIDLLRKNQEARENPVKDWRQKERENFEKIRHRKNRQGAGNLRRQRHKNIDKYKKRNRKP